MSIINQTSCAMIEQIGNRLLSLDAEAQNKLLTLKDKSVLINVQDLQLNYYFLFHAGTLVVQQTNDKKPSVSISGKLSDFIAAASTENVGDSLFTGELHFSGEINTAKQFQTLVQSLEIDWQEPISKIFGDVVGHNIATGIIKINDLAKKLINNTQQDIPEYLQEEIKVTPSVNELTQFYEQVDLIRSQTERLEARIKRLNNHD